MTTITAAAAAYLADPGTGTAATRTTYRTAMRHLAAHLTARGIDPETAPTDALTVPLLTGLAGHLIDTAHVGKRSLQTYMSAAAGFVEYLLIQDQLTWTPSQAARWRDGLKRIRRNQRPPDLTPHPVSPDHLRRLIQAAKSQPAGTDLQRLEQLRNVALILTLASTGLRVSEASNLPAKALDEESQSAWVTGKRGKARRIFWTDEAWAALTAYLDARTLAGDDAHARPTFVRHDISTAWDKPLQPRAIQTIINNAAAAAGLTDEGITPHALRHYFGSAMYQATGDLGVTQTALGHSSPATTRIYAQLTADAVSNAHARTFGGTK